ncbi:MAG: c-type cytochrome domain-containing protein [Planctomycetaceae bacterium]
MRFTVLLAISISLAPTQSRADEQLAVQTQQILKSRCGKCHGNVNPQSDFSVLNHADMLSKTLSDDESIAVRPRDLQQSELWQRIATNNEDRVMPPSGKIPADEQAIIRRWIESGAVDGSKVQTDPEPSRPYVTNQEVYEAVEHDLARHLPDETRDLRYFSIRHLHNNPNVTAADLRTYRAALSKLINSLHWEHAIVVPVAVDQQKTILRINLADIGWDRGRLWRKLLQQYPYGISYDTSRNHRLATTATNVYRATNSRIPIVRADWFITTAAVPPLYHTLLDLPDGPNADRALEYRLKVDVERDFIKNRLMRAGFVKSNVSEHNRLVDRHPAAYGAYWKSYDFASSVGRQDLTRAPLGPDFPGNEFQRHAFSADGGEIIFNLPNGMQGYMLIDGDGRRINRGPINVVFDSKQPLGNKEVINGISCMVCHNRGMQPFNDSIRQATTLRGLSGQKVSRLFRQKDEFDRVIEADSNRFLIAMQSATAPFLTPKDDPVKREPVVAIAKAFSTELDLQTIASELDIQDPSQLQPLLRQLGLGIVGNGLLMKRDTWQGLSSEQPYSQYQLVTEQLEQGTPERVF